MLHRTSSTVKTVLWDLSRINWFARASQDLHSGENCSFLALKQSCTCFTAPLWRLKRHCRVFLAHQLAYRSFKGPPQRWKQLSRSILILKHACTCFAAALSRLNRCCLHVLHRTSTVVKTAFSIFTGT